MTNPYDNQDGQPGQPYGQPGQPYGQSAYGQPAYGQPAPTGPAPANNLVWAILSTIFCCLPLGIYAIVKAAQVNSLWAQGQFAAAEKSAADAKKFAIWGAVIGVVVIVLYGVVAVAAGTS